MYSRLVAVAAAVLAFGCASSRSSAPGTALANASAAVPAPPRDPSALRYAPTAVRYLIEQSNHTVQEVMGQSIPADQNTRQVLSVAVTSAGNDLALALTIDSLEVSGTAGNDAGPLGAARGQTFRVVLAPSGLVSSVTPPDTSNAAFRQIAAGLREFLPRLPAAPITAGQTWIDTVSRTNSGELTVTVNSVREHRVVGWEDRDGTRSLHITTTSNYTLRGSGQAQGQSMELSGGGQTVRDMFVSRTGVFLGGVDSDSSLVNANVVSMGMVVPVRQNSRSTITRLP